MSREKYGVAGQASKHEKTCSKQSSTQANYSKTGEARERKKLLKVQQILLNDRQFTNENKWVNKKMKQKDRVKQNKTKHTNIHTNETIKKMNINNMDICYSHRMAQQ